MIDFRYHAPTTVQEALGLLNKSKGTTRLLAGGTDLLVQLREGLRSADDVVDVKKIAELKALAISPNGASIGSAVSCYTLYQSEEMGRLAPGVVDAARIIGGWQIQSRASLGGNLCNASPAADSIPALIACSATLRIAGPNGNRVLPVESFCVAPGKNALAAGELLVAIELPAPGPRSGSSYLRFIPRNEMDIAVVGVGAWIRLADDKKTIEKARIGVGAVAPTPLLAQEASDWLAGKPANEASFTQAGELARKIAKPISDMRGTAEYRTHLVGVLVRRSLEQALARASK